MKYRIGQRVKMINSSWGHPDTEGVITDFAILGVTPTGYLSEKMYEVTDNGGKEWAVDEENLVPILPEGWKKTHWDQCLWKPEEYECDPVMEYMRVGKAP